MFVLTADQRASTRVGDHVTALIESLRPWFAAHSDHVALPLERTVGDEVQTVLSSADAALDLALTLTRTGNWSVGIGSGPVEAPLGESARASAGPAFVAARAAVERAKLKSEPVPIVVAGSSTAWVKGLLINSAWQEGGRVFRRLAGLSIMLLGLYFIASPFFPG